MTLDEIIEMCDSTMALKGKEYASPEDRWSNFHNASHLAGHFFVYTDCDVYLSPKDCAVVFALKHYESCVAIKNGKPASPELIKEKAGDLVNYYLIWRCMNESRIVPKTREWLTELKEMPRQESMPWIIGLELLEQV